MMKARISRQSLTRFLALAAVAAALLSSNGAAGAAPREVGLTACDREGCAVVTKYDLAISRNSDSSPPTTLSQHSDIGLTECDQASCDVVQR